MSIRGRLRLSELISQKSSGTYRWAVLVDGIEMASGSGHETAEDAICQGGYYGYQYAEEVENQFAIIVEKEKDDE